MTDKEQIMIDKVDVSKCFWLWVNTDKDYKSRCIMNKDVYSQCTYCKDNPNCYFKQFARKTQECEELKRKLSNQEQLYQNEIEIYNKSCLQLRQENDDLYLERLALNTANGGINSLLEIKEQENDRCRKALEEIELTIKNLEKGDMLTFPDFTLQENATIIINQCNQGYRDILDIINKAKGLQ